MILDVLKSNLLAAAAILLTVALARLLKDRYSVRWKYVVWLATAIFLLVPVRVYAPDPVVEMNVPQQIYSRADVTGFFAGTDTDALYTDRSETDVPEQPSAAVDASPETGRMVFSVGDALNIFSVLWICGAGILLVIRAVGISRGCRRLRMLRSGSVPAGYSALYGKVCADMGLKRAPALYLCREAESPLLAGIFRPCLYLPNECYSQTELTLIFVHELSHYRHGDILFKLLMFLVRTIYWFNPALILMAREADRDLESICDSRVIACAEGKNDRLAYGRLLLRTASGSGAVRSVSAGLNDGVVKFKERMVYMMKAAKLKKGIPVAALLIVVLVAVNCLVGCSLGSDGKELQETLKENTSSASYVTGSSSDSMMATSSSSEGMPDGTSSSASSSSAEEEPSDSMSSSSSAEEEPSDSMSSSSSAAEAPSEFSYTPVPAQYRLYEVTYGDYRVYTGLEEIPENIYEIAVSNVTATSFDFSIIYTEPSGEVLDVIIEGATAVFVGDGTEARYLDDEFDLVFTFPDNHGALPDVADIEVHGFQPMEGKVYLYNGIPGHEFS